jgi:hypothetical protein
MSADELAPRSRRAILAAAAGAAGALAASAVLPAGIAAADPNDVVMGTDNPTVATTTITNSTADSTAFAGHATGTGYAYGLEGTSPAGAGVFAWSTAAPDWTPPFEPSITACSGVFGSAPAGDHTTTVGTGVWGDSPDTGVYGSGSRGVEGYGGWGVVGYTNGLTGGVGVYAIAPNTTTLALRAEGKVHFSRSKRTAIAKGKSSLTVTLAGVTSSSLVYAVLATTEPGRYVRAVVPTTNKFTVYLNTALATSSVVAWFVLD